MNFNDSYLDQAAQCKLMTKAFGIKNFKWATCSKLINRHKILEDMKQGSYLSLKGTLIPGNLIPSSASILACNGIWVPSVNGMCLDIYSR